MKRDHSDKKYTYQFDRSSKRSRDPVRGFRDTGYLDKPGYLGENYWDGGYLEQIFLDI